jgi:hypothetical protein
VSLVSFTTNPKSEDGTPEAGGALPSCPDASAAPASSMPWPASAGDVETSAPPSRDGGTAVASPLPPHAVSSKEAIKKRALTLIHARTREGGKRKVRSAGL